MRSRVKGGFCANAIVPKSHVLASQRSDRVLDWSSRDWGFEPHWHHCFVSLSKTH